MLDTGKEGGPDETRELTYQPQSFFGCGRRNSGGVGPGAGTDVFLVYAYNGPREWLETIEHSRKPNIMFLRHKSGPFYCWYENAHYRFRGVIEDVPNYPACRSQIDMKIVGDWRALLHGMPGFHAVLCYGDYLREVGYALKKTGIEGRNFSAD